MMLVPRKNRYGMDLWDDFFTDPFFRNEKVTSMRTDITEKDNEFIIDIDMPGFEKEDIKIDIENGYLTVSAEKKTEDEQKDKGGNLIRQERFYGQCQRSYYVGDNLNEEDIKASYKHGTLKLNIPKKEKAIPQKKYIAIE